MIEHWNFCIEDRRSRMKNTFFLKFASFEDTLLFNENKNHQTIVTLHHLTQWKIVRSVISNEKYTKQRREKERKVEGSQKKKKKEKEKRSDQSFFKL